MNNEQAIELFTKILEDEGRSDNTVKNYVYDVKNFAAWLQENEGVPTGDGVSYIVKKVVETYTQRLKKSGLQPTTINRRLQSLRTFFNVMVNEGVIEKNPASDVQGIKVARQNETKWLERHQVKAIFDSIMKQPKTNDNKKVQQRAIFSVLLNCGLRVQELCDLRIQDLDFDNGVLSVIGKGNKFRRVPFNTSTQQAVQLWLQYRDEEKGDYVFHSERSPQLTPRAVQHMTKKLGEMLKFNFNVHQLRHTALKNVADTTGKVEIVAAVAGHESVNTSRRYIEPSMKEIGEAMKQNEYDF